MRQAIERFWKKSISACILLVVFSLAGCGGGGGGDSSPGVPSVPPAPDNVTATAGNGEATIGWDNVAGATSYNIYFDNTTGVTKTTGNKLANRTSPSIVTALTNGTPYYFVVTAVNANGESVESSQVTATPTPAPAPPAPANVTAAAGHGEVTISWPAVTGATSYNIYFDNTTGVTKATGTKVPDATSPKIVTGLTNGTPYFFVVTAVNANGESVESSQVTATPTPAPAPPAPANVTAAAGPANATIGWDNVTGATSYNIYYSATTGVTKTTGTKVAGGTSPNVINGLIRGTPYYFVVTAVNANGESVESSQVSATPIPPAPSFSQSDLTGTWNIRVILCGTSPGWYGVTATVDGSGNVIQSGPIGPTTPPTLPSLSITPGTDTSAGVVTETGGNATFYGKMSTNKNLIVGTSTVGTTFALHVFVKRVPGVTFSSTDLANTTISYQQIYSGGSFIWERGDGSINGSGQLTLTSITQPSGPVTPPPANFTTISVDSAGFVSIGSDNSYRGVMTPDKKIIVGASTEGTTRHTLVIHQMRGQTYTQADLAGAYQAFALHSASTSSWARGIWTMDSSGTITYGPILNSSGGITNPPPGTQIINGAGEVLADGGMLSFGKDLYVAIGNFSNGSYLEVKVQ